MEDQAMTSRRGPFETGPIAGPIESGERDAFHDNQPPLEERVIMDFLEDLQRPGELGQKSIAGRIDELLASAARAPEKCDSEKIAGAMGDLCKQARDVGARLETARDKHNRPLLNAQRTLKARADGIIAPLNDAVAKLRGLLDDFTRAEAERRREDERRAAEARRIAEEAAAAALKEQGMEDQIEAVAAPAPPPPAAPAPMARGDYGSRVGSQVVWNFEIENMRQVPDRYLKHPKVKEALESVIRAAIRTEKVREMKGVRIWEGSKAVVR